MVSLDLTMSVEKPLCFGKLMIPMVKDKKSFLHGVHNGSLPKENELSATAHFLLRMDKAWIWNHS